MYSSLLYIFLLYFLIFPIQCERSGLRIIGGRDAHEEKYPYIVRLQNQITISGKLLLTEHEHVCTCTVLTSTWTLTAAHCLTIRRPIITARLIIKPVLRYGSLPSTLVSEVLYATVHPAYRFRIYDMQNDIGLIKTMPITLKLYGRISALDFVTLIGQEVTLTGYGITNTSKMIGDATTLIKPLQMLDVAVVKCDKIEVALTPAICVARRCSQSAGICPGDSGGPMLHLSGVVGINTFGPTNLKQFCALKSTIPIYDTAVITPTSPYIDWIFNTIHNDEALLTPLP